MRATLAVRDGQARLEVDGRAEVPLLYCMSAVDPREVRHFADLGVRVVSFPATADYHLYSLAKPCWIGPDRYDYGALDARIASVLDANPDALLLPRVYSCSPPWWDAEHADDLVRWDDDTTSRPLLHGAAKRELPSLGSRRWRDAMRDNVQRFVRHVEDGPYADRVLGYMVNAGNTEEWFHCGAMEGYLFDYAAGTRAAFRDWLAARYGNDAGLARAWGRDVRIDGVEVPDRTRRTERDELGFRHPVTRRDVIDFALFFSDLTADAVLELAATVKEATGGDKIFGTFFGYLLELAYHQSALANGGHLSLRRVLASPHVDFVASPSSYARRLVGEGATLSMVPGASAGLHGTAFFHENDVRTHVLAESAGYGRTRDLFETASVQRRELAFALTQGFGMWWFDMTGGWYASAAIRDVLADSVACARRIMQLPRSSVAEVALVVDADSPPFREGPPDRDVQLLPMQALEMTRMGAPFDVVLLDDLAALGPRRLLVFPNLWFCDDAKRERLHALLAASGASALWVGGPGLVGGQDIDVDHVASLTGIAVRLTAKPRCCVIDADVDGVRATYGSQLWYDRALEVVPAPAAEVLGRYREGGEAGLAARSRGEAWDFFSAAPAVAGAVLGALCDRVGVHRYVRTSDLVQACNRLVSVHARDGGPRRLDVPGTEVLVDVRDETELHRGANGFEIRLPRGDTATYFRGSGEAWEALRPSGSAQLVDA